MADRFIVSDGSFADPAVWSETEFGAGGASVPTTGDTIRCMSVRSLTNVPVSIPSSLYIRKDCILSLDVDTAGAVSIAPSVTFEDDSRLTLSGPVSGATNGCQLSCNVVMGERSVFEHVNGYVGLGRRSSQYPDANVIAAASAMLIPNSGVVSTSATDCRFNTNRIRGMPWAVPAVRCKGIARLWTTTNDERPIYRFSSTKYRYENLWFYARASYLLYVVADRAEIEIENELRFQDGTATLDFVDTKLIVGGNISCDSVLSNYTIVRPLNVRMSGGKDQSVSFPSGFDNSVLELDKIVNGRRRGTVDLQNFNGSVVGDGIVPGESDSLIVRGPSVATMGNLNLDSLTVYGIANVENGKTVSAQNVDVPAGGSLSGLGTLRIDAATWKSLSSDVRSRITCTVEQVESVVLCRKNP